MFFIEWWNSLGIILQIFYCIAIPATLVLLIQTVMMLIGLGDDGDVGDADVGNIDDISDVPDEVPDGVFGEDSISDTVDASGLEGLRIFTVRGIVAFFVVFGWVGVVMLGANVHLAITLAVAAVSGFAMMVALAFLFKAVMKLRSDGNTDNRNAIGKSGKVYLTIPPARSGSGKVEVILQGSCVERNAVTDETEPIPTGTEIVVVGVSGQVDLVVKRK
ncbi:MAG: NfeD-like protein [Ruminococcaceae bacterium]|nr:NfeD-like protein [Oscillospiraceae bacterium]